MTTWTLILYVYLSGVGLKAVLMHGLLQNPNLREGANAGKALRSCLLWPLNLFGI